MRTLLAVLLCLCSCTQSPAQTLVAPESLAQGFVIIVEDKAKLSGQESPIYIGSNIVNWTPGHPSMKMSPRSDGRWQIVLPKPAAPGPMEFKFTRGSWETVEIAPDLSDTANRKLEPVDASKLAPGEQPRFEFVVQKWADQRPDAQARKAIDSYRTLKVTGDVRRLQVVGGGGISLVRDLLVWVPPGYNDPKNAQHRYPVLYLQDGQNVFEQLPGVPGEWAADEAATELIRAGRVQPLIIVAVPHSGPYRSQEYLTVPYKDVQPHGREYAAWLAGSIVPRVDAAFRTKADPGGRAVGGSSLGAHVARYAAAMYPQVFGNLLAESPAVISPLEGAKGYPRRVVIGAGGLEMSADESAPENQRYTASVKALAESYSQSLGADNVLLRIDPAARHNEPAWAARFPAALEFLFPPDKR